MLVWSLPVEGEGAEPSYFGVDWKWSNELVPAQCASLATTGAAIHHGLAVGTVDRIRTKQGTGIARGTRRVEPDGNLQVLLASSPIRESA